MGKKTEWLKGNSKKETQPARPVEHGKFLYQQAYQFDKAAETINKLAGKSGESVSNWKAKIENRVLHLNAAARDEATALINRTPEPYTVRHTFSKFSGISNRAAKRAGLLDIGRHIEFQHAQELHKLWLQYVSEILSKQNTAQTIARTLALCDLQGAQIEVIQSTCASYVGIAGIIVRETQHAFNVVREDSSVVLVLKAGSVFAVKWKNWTFHIHGVHMVATPAQRSKRKLKAKTHL